jgi:hypothetical protein
VRRDSFAREYYGKSVLALAVRWLLDRGKIVALWGARRPEQLAPVSEVMGWKLDANAMQEIDQILSEIIKDEVGPEFMAPPPSTLQTNGESSEKSEPVQWCCWAFEKVAEGL